MIRRLLVVVLLSQSAITAAEAGVTRLQIDRRETVLGGKPFGAAGPYEKLIGTVHFALDPALPQNLSIVDLTLAPRNAQGLVEFSADFYLLKPVDPARGNGRVFYFQPGHETYPTYHQKEIQQVITNAVRWAAPIVNLPDLCPNSPPLEPMPEDPEQAGRPISGYR